MTPTSKNHLASHQSKWQVSPRSPALNQFGYLASSLTLSEREAAQAAVINYMQEARNRRFAIDGMHLSSGYCQDPETNERQYFEWNRRRYPDPEGMGKILETDEHCQVIINIKPWLLDSHPQCEQVAKQGAFVRAGKDVAERPDLCGPAEQSNTWYWSASMGQTLQGSYFDFSSEVGTSEWQRLVRQGVLAQNITGPWINNNEYSNLTDDTERFSVTTLVALRVNTGPVPSCSWRGAVKLSGIAASLSTAGSVHRLHSGCTINVRRICCAVW